MPLQLHSKYFFFHLINFLWILTVILQHLSVMLTFNVSKFVRSYEICSTLSHNKVSISYFFAMNKKESNFSLIDVISENWEVWIIKRAKYNKQQIKHGFLAVIAVCMRSNRCLDSDCNSELTWLRLDFTLELLLNVFLIFGDLCKFELKDIWKRYFIAK